jgi:hypothetical protein
LIIGLGVVDFHGLYLLKVTCWNLQASWGLGKGSVRKRTELNC